LLLSAGLELQRTGNHTAMTPLKRKRLWGRDD
jgi:hypothetical protein